MVQFGPQKAGQTYERTTGYFDGLGDFQSEKLAHASAIEAVPRMLRESTFSVADGHIKCHLEADWNEIPVEHIDIDTVNEWIRKKRQEDLSWVTIKNILRTMQRVLSCSSKDKKPPFSQEGLAIPERDKLQMKIESREAISFSWLQTKQVAKQVHKLDVDHTMKERYATVFLVASTTGLRCGELFALKLNDIDFKAARFAWMNQPISGCT